MTTVLDDKMANFGKIQKEMGDLYSVKQGALAQFNENTLVKSELEGLTDEKVFKLVGPLLYPIETDEAKENVGKRLDFINREISQAEKKIEEKNATLQLMAAEIQRMQAEMRAEAAKAAAEAAAAAGGV